MSHTAPRINTVKQLEGMVIRGCAYFILFACSMAVLGADKGSLSQPIEFNIPTQSMDAALVAFSRQSGVQIIYDSGLVSGHISPEVRGRLSISAALTAVLNDSGLVPHFTGLNSITLKVRGASNAIALDRLLVKGEVLIGDNPAYQEFVRLLQAAIAERLKSTDIRKESYVALLRVWVNSDGRVERVSRMESDNDSVKSSDNVIAAANLLSIDLHKPLPIGLRQPMIMRISVRTQAQPR